MPNNPQHACSYPMGNHQTEIEPEPESTETESQTTELKTEAATAVYCKGRHRLIMDTMPPKARPLSISSISSAASSGSSTSTNSSSSSGIQSSLTRNSSLNYSQEFRKQSYLASIESLDSSLIAAGSSPNCANHDCDTNHHQANSSSGDDHHHHHHGQPGCQTIEVALKNLNLSSSHFKDLAATRAAVLAAGESQRRSFGTSSGGDRLTRINRSLHSSLRYDKNTAYRIHLMANARALLNNNGDNNNPCQQQTTPSSNFKRRQQQAINTNDETDAGQQQATPAHRYSSISRNNSSTSSDSGHLRQSTRDKSNLQRFRCTCPPNSSATPSSITSSPSSSSLVAHQHHHHPQNVPSDNSTTHESGGAPNSSLTMEQYSVKQKAATIDNAACQRNATTPLFQKHHPDCLYLKRPRRASAKLQQSPSSVSSYSNSSSLFRDDGFEDDLTSTTSENSSTIYQHHHNHQYNHSQHHEHHRQLFYHQNQNHHLSYHHHEAGLGPLSISQRVVTEIIETERSYVDDLEQIVTGYLCYLRDTLEQHAELFSNLEEIYKFNKDFLFQLEECYLNPGAVAACFVENASKFDVYTHYCTMYPEVVSTLTQLMANPTTAQVLKERQMELNQSLPLGAYLLKPVQRILKYHILFKSLIKHTADDETVIEKDRELINEAFSVMTNIACHINEMKKKHEHSIRVQELQGLLIGWEVSIIAISVVYPVFEFESPAHAQ